MNTSKDVLRLYRALGLPFVVFMAIAVHFVGSTALAVVVSGPKMAIAGSVIAVFGLPLLPIEMALVAIQWYLYLRFSFSDRAYWWLFFVSVFVIPFCFAVVGPKEENSEFQWGLGLGLGAAAGGLISLMALRGLLLFVSYYVRRREEETVE